MFLELINREIYSEPIQIPPLFPTYNNHQKVSAALVYLYLKLKIYLMYLLKMFEIDVFLVFLLTYVRF